MLNKNNIIIVVKFLVAKSSVKRKNFPAKPSKGGTPANDKKATNINIDKEPSSWLFFKSVKVLTSFVLNINITQNKLDVETKYIKAFMYITLKK